MDEKDIQKFAHVEGCQLLMKHCETVYKWAKEAVVMPPASREALLATVARMYQIIEGMPGPDGQKPKPR